MKKHKVDRAERLARRLVKPVRERGDIVFKFCGFELLGYKCFPDDPAGIAAAEEEIIGEVASALRKARKKED